MPKRRKSYLTRSDVLEIVERFVDSQDTPKFIAGESYVPASGKVVGAPEVRSVLDAALDMWFTEGRFATYFEKDLRTFLNNEIRHAILCNSGSSANLLAVSAITAPEFGHKQAKKGDEVITVASGFPTTLNPILQNGLVPHFVDVELATLVPNPEHIEQMIAKRTKAIFMAHPLGNAFDADAIEDIAAEYDIFLIEDTCDALGGTLNGKFLGTFGDMSTLSFYPAHQMTAGEGGAVLTRSPMIKKVVESYRDWGRDCWCTTGKDNTCGKRFNWQLGDLPMGYDHKYIYNRIGYNLKSTDLQAAILVEQIKRLTEFIEKRRYNWSRLRDALDKYSKYFIMPQATEGSSPSWFGFYLTVKEIAPFTRHDITTYLESKKIGTRLLFGGNLLKQPAYKGVQHRIFSELHNTNYLMRGCFWVGVWPGLTDAHIDYMVDVFDEFMRQYESK